MIKAKCALSSSEKEHGLGKRDNYVISCGHRICSNCFANFSQVMSESPVCYYCRKFRTERVQ